MTAPMLGHLDPVFLEVLDEVCDKLRNLFHTTNALTLPLSGTGSAGMEASFVNFVRPGDPVVIGVNGVFGERMCEVADRVGAQVIRVDGEWGAPLDPQSLLRAHRHPSIIAAVHAETSTGVENDIAALGAEKGDALLLADMVTSLGGIPVEVDAWGVDIAYAGTQKCLGVPPGLSPFTVSERALSRRVERPSSWYLDLGLLAKYVDTQLGARVYHHTAPITMIRALEAGLGVIASEGEEAVIERHRQSGNALQAGLEDREFILLAEKGSRLPQLTTVHMTKKRLGDRSEAQLRKRLLDEYSIEVGGGAGKLQGAIWRIGCMGHSARKSNVATFLAAFDAIMEAP
jgi:alanine-glyoxylate transaminase/serine-glyoxylate transaminase/serine-pyruvate transaminase